MWSNEKGPRAEPPIGRLTAGWQAQRDRNRQARQQVDMTEYCGPLSHPSQLTGPIRRWPWIPGSARAHPAVADRATSTGWGYGIAQDG